MNIENLKNMPAVGQPADISEIAAIAGAVAERNEAIRAAVLAAKTAEEAKVDKAKVDSVSAETARFNAWQTNHEAAMKSDTSGLDTIYTTAQANLANIVSNAQGISDSISEFAADVQSNKDAVNADINTKTSTLENARAQFRTDMGTASDLVLV